MPPESILNSQLFTAVSGLTDYQKYVVFFFIKGSSEESNDAWVLTDAGIPEPAVPDLENIKLFKNIYDANTALQDALNCMPPAEFFGVVPLAWYADWSFGTGPLKNFRTPAQQASPSVNILQPVTIPDIPNGWLMPSNADDNTACSAQADRYNYNDLSAQIELLAKQIKSLEIKSLEEEKKS